MPGGRLRARLPLAGVLLAGGALRFATLGQQSFWLDEAASGRLVRMGLGGMLGALPDGESTPPLYYLLAWIWARAFGTSEIGLRSLSALIGTLTILLVYGGGARLLGRRAGLAAAALTAFSPLLIWYSQEARSYALLVGLCAASLWALAAALEPSGGRRAVVVWTVIAALALASHYFAAFVIAPELIWLVRARGRRAAPALLGVVLAGAALAPLALHQRGRGGAAFIASSPGSTRTAQAAKQLAAGYAAPGELVLGVAAGLCVVALAWLLGRRAGRAALALAGVAAAAVCLPAVLALLGLDYVITRNLIGAWVPAALALGGGAALSGTRAGPAAIAGLCAVGVVTTLGIDLDGRYQRDNWRAAVRTLPRSGATALVVTPASGRIPVAYYLRGSRPLPVAGAAVTWVEVIALGRREVGAPVRAPRIPTAAPLLAGFAAPVAERSQTFSVLRYRATGSPVLVSAAVLAPLALVASSPATILARSG